MFNTVNLKLCKALSSLSIDLKCKKWKLLESICN